MLEPGDEVERYEIVRLIGEGGMARVYLARHTTLDTLHAVKVLTMTGPSLKDRLVAEGRVQAGLRHPNIVRVSDVLDVDGMPALVMDYVDGPDLAHWIGTECPDPALAERVFRGIVAGVQAAHAAGVAHRDLKPANVLMARDGDEWIPKVSDFGLVKALQGDNPQVWKTRSGLPMGTPQYMAPEQIRDAANVDHRADLFSLGCILYELLAHHPAYTGDDILEIFERVRAGERKRLTSAPARLVGVVDSCLQLEAERRPRDCATLLSLLDSEAPTVAVPAPAGVPTWAVGAGAGAILGSVLLVAGLLGVGTLLWWALQPGQTAGGCPRSGGVIGYVRAPLLFARPAGSTWNVPRDVDVVASIEDGEVVCVLVAGSELELVDGVEGGWIPVQGDAITDPTEPPPAEEEPEPEEVVDPPPATDCPEAEPGTVIGYATARVFLLQQGSVWPVNASKDVYADYPRDENGFDVDRSRVVCRLQRGARVRLDEAPLRLRGAGVWIPIVAGAIGP